ncbi:MAG: DUF3396 domain-containing protein [Thermoplasmata archaeon]|nr:DUF3396 domain-containing protein [Thermoplasmata archaeon]
MGDEVWFVGVWGFLSGEVGWNGIGKAAKVILDLVAPYNAPRISYSRFMSNGNKERIWSRKMDEDELHSTVKELGMGDILSLNARTTRGEWASMEKGHWFYLHLGSEYDDERMPYPEVGMHGTFPLSMFREEEKSEGYELLIDFLHRMNDAAPILYMYSNLSRWDRYPGIHGVDKLYAQTARHIPLSNIDDMFCRGPLDVYRRGVKGAFWLNILNRDHIDALGGVDRIEEKSRPYIMETLPHGRVMIQVTPSPIVADTPENREAFARLFELFKPIYA